MKFHAGMDVGWIIADPVESAEYLNPALEDGSKEVFLMSLKDVANAIGISEIS